MEIPNDAQKRFDLLSKEEILEQLRLGNTSVLSKAITLTESTLPQDQVLLREIIQSCKPNRKTIRIGITGVPGVGKSTFIDAIGKIALLDSSKKIAVLAVDPSSSKTGGSILGDKTRMEFLSKNEQAYIRPFPARNHLGGVTAGLSDAIALCEESAFDYIFVETVGVGQSETEVAHLVDMVIFLLLPNSGDDLQGIKRGIMEEVHFIVINKAEAENSVAAKKTKLTLESIIQLMLSPDHRLERKVHLCSAHTLEGIMPLWMDINQYHEKISKDGSLVDLRKSQRSYIMNSFLHKLLLESFYNTDEIKGEVEKMKIEVEQGKIDPKTAAEKLVKLFRN